MALIKVSKAMGSTPSIVDNGNATAITINSSEEVTFAAKVTAVGTSVFTNLDISGDVDIDGTTNLDVVDIDGAVDMASTLAVAGSVGIGTSLPTQSDGNSHFLYGGGSNGFVLSATEGPIAVSSNVTINSGEKYVRTGFASKNYQLDGAHVWQTAASGSAGAAISFSEHMRITPGGYVGIGTAAPAQKLHVNGTGHMFTLENTSTGTNEYSQQLLKSGTALNYFWGANQNTTSWGGASSLNIQSSYGAIAFFTAGSTLRMRIHETSGNIDIPNGNLSFASGHGIQFAATADAAGADNELLDDYEEGYWTPTITGSTGGAQNMSVAVGSYTKIGNLIHLTWYCGSSSLGSATGYMRVGGIPYTALSGGTSNSRITTGSIMSDNLTLSAGKTWVVPYMSDSASDIKFYQSGSGVVWLETPCDAVFSMIGGISYRTV